jgi:GTP cyclohydrolase I
MNQENIQQAIKQLLTELDSDIERDGLKKTPERVAKAYQEMLGGYNRSLAEEATFFENTEKYDDIIYSGGINFFSICEHHLLPFYGKAHIAYIPDKKIIGLSKLSRAVDIYARRLQDQERITMQVTNELDELLEAKGVAVVLEAKHFCNMARGVAQLDSFMKTSAFKGQFKDASIRDQFMSMID